MGNHCQLRADGVSDLAEAKLWRTPVVVWAAFIRVVTLYRVVLLSKDTVLDYSCRCSNFKLSRPNRSQEGRA